MRPTPTPAPGRQLPDRPIPAAAGPSDGALTPQRLARWREQFAADRSARLMQNAVTRTKIEDVALNRRALVAADHTFSHLLDDWSVTNQQKSGRCWLFAGLNLLRVGAMKKMNLKDFEFSQTYPFFWDKLERANYFLEAILATADRPVDDRTVAWLLDHPLDDGGQWNMFVNLIRKYGLAPKAAMPETAGSGETARMNANLLTLLRQGAKELRDLHQQAPDHGIRGQASASDAGAAAAHLRQAKDRILQSVYRVLSIHLGTPPDRFDWQWNDKDRKFGRDGELTPRQFAERYVTLPLEEYVCLVHDPRPACPAGRTFTVEHLGNIVGGEPVRYLNVPIEVMKDAAMRTVMDGEPVWFGCDVGQQMQRELGVWDAELYDFQGVYDTRFMLDKAQRLLYHETMMTHAMLFTGVDVVGGADAPRPRRWRVENSWGEDNGRKGFYVMNDNWFDEHLFEVAVRRSYLPPELRDAIELEPIVLPPWDPMGALARSEVWP